MYPQSRAAGRRRHRLLTSLPLALCFAHPALSALTTLSSGLLGHCPNPFLTSLTPVNAPQTCASESASGSSSSSPWTFAPRCALDTGTEQEKYCVYTAGAFNDHAGTSFVVQPDTIGTPVAFAEMRRMDPRTQRYLGTTTASNLGKTNQDIKYMTRSLAGKGIGTLSTRKIRRGEIYMVSHPAVVIDQELEKEPDPWILEGDRHALLQTAFMQLSDRERATGLAGSTGGNRWEDILRTNGFTITVGTTKCSALFPEQARLNHACVPNSVIRFVGRTFALEAMAIRDIEAGEELTISYIPADMPSAQRAETLKEAYNFSCTCPLCSASSTEAQESDSRRKKIRDIKGHILNLASNSKSDDKSSASSDSLVPLAKELVELVKAEPGLAALKLREYLGELAVLFAKRQNFEVAVEFARDAVKEAEGLGADGRGDNLGAGMRANLEFLENKMREIEAANA